MLGKVAAGIITNIPLAGIALTRCVTSYRCRSAGVVVALALLPTFLGHCCRRGAGVAWASLPPRRRHRLGIVAIVALALLLCWYRCHHCLGIFAVTALASLQLLRWTSSPSWRWHHRCCRDDAVLPSRRCRHCWGQPGACAIVGIVTLASSLPSP